MKNRRKSSNVNLENKKSIFFEMGMAIALLLVFAAFQWKSYDNGNSILISQTDGFVIDESVPITIQKPPPPPVIPPKSVVVINIVKSTAIIDDFPDIDAGADGSTPIPDFFPVAPEKRIKESEIFVASQIMPEFPGGIAALMNYFAKQIKYPEIAKEADTQGIVYVYFVIEPDGSVSNVKVLRGIGSGCDAEAIRIVKNMPKWKPGIQAGRPVRVSFTIPVKFALQ